MKLIAGLGNPTSEYVGTRHNIGFAAVTRLADRFDIRLLERKHKAIIGKGIIAGEKVIIAKPQTYMNLSGESIREILDFYKMDASDLIVVYDDIDLAVGQLRIREKGSAGGHNGIKNIILHTGTEKFTRIRIGVGEKPEGYDLADYVLGHFKKEEQDTISDALDAAGKAVEIIIRDGCAAAMNEFNRKNKEK